MKKIVAVLLSLICFNALAQETFLPRNINHTAKNNMIPALSMDGKSMIFLTDYTNSGGFELVRSEYIRGRWGDPIEVISIKPQKTNNIGGYSLSADGKTIWFSTNRPDGLGAFDIWYLNLNPGGWSGSRNPGKPLNSKANEGNPSISPDGEQLYFMRCQNMSKNSANNCKLYVSDKNKGRGLPWKEPTILPDNVNLGDVRSPRILGDNKTLIFSSDRLGGKGGFDLWSTTKTNDGWSDPINLSFANTAEDDEYISLSLRSDRAYYTRINDRGYRAIVEAKVPEKFRPQNTIMLLGNVASEEGEPLVVDIRVNNYETGKLDSFVKSLAKDGSFTAVLPEGIDYEVSIVDRSGKRVFESFIYRAANLRTSKREYPKIVLKDFAKNLVFELRAIDFIPNEALYTPQSSYELLRLLRLLKQNPLLGIDVEVYLKEYLQDSIPSDYLTELRIDSIVHYEQAIMVDTMNNTEIDSLLLEVNKDLNQTYTDTITAENYLVRMNIPDSIAVTTIKNIFHNDRTEKQAQAIKDFFLSKQIDEARVSAKGMKDTQPPFLWREGQEFMVVVRVR